MQKPRGVPQLSPQSFRHGEKIRPLSSSLLPSLPVLTAGPRSSQQVKMRHDQTTNIVIILSKSPSCPTLEP